VYAGCGRSGRAHNRREALGDLTVLEGLAARAYADQNIVESAQLPHQWSKVGIDVNCPDN